LPSINRGNVGTCTVGDLMFAVDLFDAKYSGGDA